MAGPFHTYDPSCLLADEQPQLSSLYALSTPPDIQSQFFYISSLPIDDPLAPLPPASGQPTGNEKAPPKPFSARDNAALETAWRKLGEAQHAKPADESSSRPDTSKGRSGIAVPGLESSLEVEHRCKAANREGPSLRSSRSTPSSFADDQSPRNLKSRARYLASSSDARAEIYPERRQAGSPIEDGGTPSSSGAYKNRERSFSPNESRSAKRRYSIEDDDQDDGQDDTGSLRANRSRDASISGSPFIRAPISQSHTPLARSVESLPLKDGPKEGQAEVRSSASNRAAPKPSGLRATVSLDEMAQDTSREESSTKDPQTNIAVGASRLHLVELPNLKVWMFLILSRHYNDRGF